MQYIALFTLHKLTQVKTKLTQVSFCCVNTVNPGSTRIALEVSCKQNPGEL